MRHRYLVRIITHVLRNGDLRWPIRSGRTATHETASTIALAQAATAAASKTCGCTAESAAVQVISTAPLAASAAIIERVRWPAAASWSATEIIVAGLEAGAASAAWSATKSSVKAATTRNVVKWTLQNAKTYLKQKLIYRIQNIIEVITMVKSFNQQVKVVENVLRFLKRKQNTINFSWKFLKLTIWNEKYIKTPKHVEITTA